MPQPISARADDVIECCAFVLALLLHRGLARNHGELRRRALERLPGLRATVAALSVDAADGAAAAAKIRTSARPAALRRLLQ